MAATNAKLVELKTATIKSDISKKDLVRLYWAGR